MNITITHRGKPVNLPETPTESTTLGELRAAIATTLQTSTQTTKLLTSGKQLAATEDATPIADLLKPSAKLIVLAPLPSTLSKLLSSSPDTSAPPDELVARRPLAKFVAEPRCTSSATAQTSVHEATFGFDRIEALPGHADSARARAILLRLATDSGILSVMREKRWRVGLLTELRPEGRVGETPCLLGLNVNRGAEIRLRIRTDDWQGFRTIAQMLQVLAHELAHCVYGAHDNDFKELMRWIERRVHGADWRGVGGRVLGDGGRAEAVPSRVFANTGQTAGRRLGGMRGVSRLLRPEEDADGSHAEGDDESD